MANVKLSAAEIDLVKNSHFKKTLQDAAHPNLLHPDTLLQFLEYLLHHIVFQQN